jgi:hypothetical protein
MVIDDAIVSGSGFTLSADELPSSLTVQAVPPRRRVNMSTSVKGVVTWDLTVEALPESGMTIEDLFGEVDRMRAECEARCPIDSEK